jgi:putative transposase
MLTGIRTHFNPEPHIAQTLSQWIGCARVIYNAKCDEDRYLRKFAAKYLPVGTFPEVNKASSYFKDPELTPWLSDCPSQILRNSATIWARTYQRFFNGLGGRPQRKTRAKGNYIWLTQELFRVRWEGRACILTLGTQAKPIGTVRVKWNQSRVPQQNPKSIWIRKTAHRWYLSFSYDDGNLAQTIDPQEHLDHLKRFSHSELEAMITPVDRGVAKPLHTDNAVYVLTPSEKKAATKREQRLRRYQRRMARQVKGSNRRRRTIQRISCLHEKTACVRENFWHQTTRALVDNAQVVVIENLQLKNMTRRAKAKQDEHGRWVKNGSAAKSGLNKAMLDVALGRFEVLLSYKMEKAGKPLFKVAPNHTSQECASCGHIHPGNRKNQSDFKCLQCGREDNADHNAAIVIRKRAIKLILDSGTELVGARQNVLKPRASDNPSKTPDAKAVGATGRLSKKKVAAMQSPEARVL